MINHATDFSDEEYVIPQLRAPQLFFCRPQGVGAMVPLRTKMLVNRATTVQLMQSTPLGGASSPARANSGLVGSDVMIRVSSKFESKGSSNVLSGGSQDALYFYEGDSNCGTQEPLAQFASGSSRKLDSFAERFRLELARTRKRKEVSLEDCIIPPDLARDDRLSRPLLCDVPFVIAPDAVIGLDSGGKYRPAEMDACAALVSLGGLSTGQAHSAARSVSNSRLLVHFSASRPDSFRCLLHTAVNA